MDEPMKYSCADPIKNGAEETLYVSVEIDTQATDGYDEAFLNDNVFKQIPDVAPRAPPVSNTEPRYTVPLDHDDPVLDFKFAKPAHKQPVFRPTKPSAENNRAPPLRGSTPAPEISGGVQKGSDASNSINESKTVSESTIEINAELPIEVEARQRPALKQKDPNAQLSENIPAKHQKRGVSFAAYPINNDQQPIQSLRPQQTRQLTPTPRLFLDIQPRTKKRHSTATSKTSRQPLFFPHEDSYANHPHISQSGSIPSASEHQSVAEDGILQQGRALSFRTGVDNKFDVDYVLGQHAAFSGHGPPFCPRLEEHSTTITRNSDYKQPSSPMTLKSAANRMRTASICSNDNDRIGKLLAANMPFPEATYPANPLRDNGERMPHVGRPMLANRSERQRNLVVVGPHVNLQNKVQITPKCSPAADNQNDPTGGDRSIPQLEEGENHSGDELNHIIYACVEKGKQKLHEQIQVRDAQISEISKKNEDYEEAISELRATNSSLSEKLKTIKERADALNERAKLQLEECKSLGEFVTKHKSDTAEYRQEAESMRTSLIEAKNGLEGLQLYQRNSRVRLEETKALATHQIGSFNSLKKDLEMYKSKLQQERDNLRLLQKELQEQRQDKDLKDTIKGFLESHYLGVTDRLAIQESKLSEAISNADTENQSRLSDCLGLLKSMIEKSQEAPKEVLEIRGLLETLFSSIGDRLQCADDGSEALRNAGTEVMEALKSRINTLFEIQDAKRGLEERISCLQVSNARQEVASRGHEERIRELQNQLIAKESELDRCRAEFNLKSEWSQIQVDDKQKELDKCQEDLATKDGELGKAQAKIEAGFGYQNELAILQATYAKTASDLANATEALKDCQATSVEQGKLASVMQVQNTDLAERLRSAEQKTFDIERKLLQLKECASESLERQQVEAETERRRSLESEKRSHVQKVSNLQNLRAEAEAMIEGLKEDVQNKEQLILALETEKARLEGENKEQAERLVQLDQASISQVAEYQSLTKALKSTGVDIAQLERKLALNEENTATDSLIVSEINGRVEAVIRENLAVKTRLEAYERIEAKVQDYCQKSGIPFEVNAIGAVLGIIDRSGSQISVVAKIPSQNNGVGNGMAAPHLSKGQATSFTPKVVRHQVPNSLEILDSQIPPAPSSSPLPRRAVRSIAPQSSPRVDNGPPSNRGSFEVTRKSATEVTKFRGSATRISEDAHYGTLSRKLEVEDSQDIGGKLTRSPSYSSLSELDSDEFSQANDCYIVASDHLENKQGRREEVGRGKRHIAASKKTDNTLSRAQGPKLASKIQANMPLKSCLKQTTPESHLVEEKPVSNDTVKTTLSDPTSMKPPTSRQGRMTRLASISSVNNPSKKLPSNDTHTGRGNTSRLDPKQSLTPPLRSVDSVSHENVRKRTMASLSSDTKSESPTKRVRLSLPGRDFQAVSPFVPEGIKRRESSGPSLESQ